MTTNVRPWSELNRIIDEVYKYVCGHASINDIKILLKRNNMYTDDVEKYLNHVIDSCCDCAKTYEPQKARKVSLSSVSRSSYETICVDHFCLGNLCIIHIMDASMRYSASTAVPDTGMEAEN